MNRIGMFSLNTLAVLAGGVGGAIIGHKLKNSSDSAAEGAIIGAGVGNAIVWAAMLAFPGTNSPTSPSVGTAAPSMRAPVRFS